MEEHMDQMADLIHKFSSELRSGLRPAADNFIGFFHAIDWEEPWLIGLLGFHGFLLVVTIFTRKRTNFQMFLFLLALGEEENETFFIRVWKPLPSIRVLKTLRLSPRTISASGEIGLLRMVSEPDTGRCASEEAEPRRFAGPCGGVDCEISYWLGGELNIFYKVAGVYFAERINRILSKNWKSFATHNYFDPNGVSTLWSGPLLVISMIILINTLLTLCYLVVRWKRAELRHLARLSQSKED